MSLADLGRRAVACKHFYWMPGMSLSNGRTIGTWKEGEVCGSSDTSPPYDGAVYPMLDDPATLGCLLHLVREAWGSDEWSRNVVPVFNGIDAWTVGCLDMQGRKAPRLLFLVNKINCMPVGIGSSEAEALVIALEAAP